MKKILILLVFCLFPLTAYADEGIEVYYIKATVEENGDLIVEEYFYLNGEYNGMEREILYSNDDLYDFRPELEYYGGSKLQNGSGIELLEIRALPITEDFDFENIGGTLFEEVSDADVGDYGVYTIEEVTGGEAYQIYLPDNKNEAFYIKYRLKDMAILHDDVAELYWNAIGDSLRESIGTLKITVIFPGNEEEFRVWAHGPLNGTINIVSQEILAAEVDNVYSYQAVDIRAVFDKSVIASSAKKSNVIALAKILNYESDLASQANYERLQEEYRNEQNAYEEIAYCRNNLYRFCYENAEYYVSLVQDEEVRAELEQELAELYILITEKEESEAKEDVEYALKYQDYFWYDTALNSVAILENEELKNELLAKLAEVRKYLETEEETYNKIATRINLIVMLGLFGIGILVYFKCDKEYKGNFNHKYMREFPNTFSPSTVEYLMKKKITEQSISAEILYLIYEGKITATEEKEKKDILLVKNEQKLDDISEKEKALLNLIFSSSDQVYLKDLKKKAKTSTSFAKAWKKLNKKMLNEALAEKLYEGEKAKISNPKKKPEWQIWVILIVLMVAVSLNTFIFFLIFIAVIIYYRKTGSNYLTNSPTSKIKRWSRVYGVLTILYVIIGIILLFTQNHFIYEALNTYIVILLLAFILLIYIAIAKKRTKKGAEAYQKWQAFKRFLQDFSLLDEKSLPEVILWEKYLVYAIVLGCAKKLSKTMKIKLESMNQEYQLTFDPITFTNFTIISRAVSSTVHSTRASLHTSSSGGSNWSSGSGGGGGFSSGGGFGGGGGGGGRF